jgi:hypothetical protein
VTGRASIQIPMPADPLRPVPDALSREDLLLLEHIATEQGDEGCIEWCARALSGDALALSYLRQELLHAREDEVAYRRAEIWVLNTDGPPPV